MMSPLGTKDRRLEAFWLTAKGFILLAVCELGIIFLILYLLTSGLLEVQTVVSVVLSEVGIAVILYYLLGEHRRSSQQEIVNLAETVEKFSSPAQNSITMCWLSTLPLIPLKLN